MRDARRVPTVVREPSNKMNRMDRVRGNKQTHIGWKICLHKLNIYASCTSLDRILLFTIHGFHSRTRDICFNCVVLDMHDVIMVTN
jgi:hypothetical protein